MDPIVVQQGSTRKVAVELATYRGEQRVDIRTWYLDENGVWQRTKQGVSLSLDELPNLVKVLQSITAEAKKEKKSKKSTEENKK